MQYFLVPYAYDYIDPAKGTGAGTEARIDAGMNTLTNRLCNVVPFEMILTAGYSKESPHTPTKSHPISLAEMMGKYTQATWPRSYCHAHIKPSAWGTLEETEEAIRTISELRRPGVHTSIVVSSHKYHIPRIWLCWKLLPKPFRYTLTFVKANHRFTKKEILAECVKFVLYTGILLLGRVLYD